ERARERRGEGVGERVVTTRRPHHEQPRSPSMYLFEQNLRRSSVRRDGVQAMRSAMCDEELTGEIRDGDRLRAIAMDRHHVDIFAAGQTEELKELEGAGRLTSAAVRDDHATSAGKLPRHDHDRPSTALDHAAQPGVRLVLRLEAEVCLAAEQHRVAALSLPQDPIDGIADILQYG